MRRRRSIWRTARCMRRYGSGKCAEGGAGARTYTPGPCETHLLSAPAVSAPFCAGAFPVRHTPMALQFETHPERMLHVLAFKNVTNSGCATGSETHCPAACGMSNTRPDTRASNSQRAAQVDHQRGDEAGCRVHQCQAGTTHPHPPTQTLSSWLDTKDLNDPHSTPLEPNGPSRSPCYARPPSYGAQCAARGLRTLRRCGCVAGAFLGNAARRRQPGVDRTIAREAGHTLAARGAGV